MMKTRRVVLGGVLALVVPVVLLSVHLLPTAAVETQLVRIFGTTQLGVGELSKPIRLEPSTLTVSKGAVVIWLNWARTAQCVKIVFEEGKKCEDVTDAPTGFALEGPCYVTSWITFGGTSSLKFNEPGVFSYEVQAKAGGQVFKQTGRIVVQ